MSKSIQQIEKDLADLEKQVSEFAITFSEKYQHYLESLSQIARQQLILAGYQICTQIYPKSFLELSLSVRQSLQEQIRNYANNIETRIRTALDFSFQENSSYTEAKVTTIRDYVENLKKPYELITWIQNTENKIHQVLNQYSILINQSFLEKNILPNNISPKLVEMAIEAQEEGAGVNGSNNLLQIVITEENSLQQNGENKEPKINNIVIVHIKLAELEFNNPALGLEHQQIRSSVDRLKTLSQVYQQKQKELVIAQAQAAWRAIWYDS